MLCLLKHAPGDFPESERAAAETLALPIYPELTRAQLDHVVASVADFYRSAAGGGSVARSAAG